MDTPDPSVANQARAERIYVDRADRREFRTPVRFRRVGSEEWLMGETINLSETGLLFTPDELFEVFTSLSISFHNSGKPLSPRSTHVARIVRRTLSNWPETRIIFAVAYCS